MEPLDTNQLRLVASYHMGTDIIDRLGFAERVQRQQRDALTQAADLIDSLRARVTKLEYALADDGELPEELQAPPPTRVG